MRIIRGSRRSRSSNIINNSGSYQNNNFQIEKYKGIKLSESIDNNISLFKTAFKNSMDVKFREFLISKGKIRALLLFIDGIIDKPVLNENVLEPLMFGSKDINLNKSSIKNPIEYIKQSLAANVELDTTDTIDKAVEKVLNANAVLIVDGYSTAVIIGVQKWEDRSIQEPQTESVIRGPRDGFTETLKVNVSLIRKRIKSSSLKCESMKIGEISGTDITICYLEGIVNEEVLSEVRTRISRIKIDAILESTYIEELIEDSPLSPFPQVRNTERPDVAAAAILEGRVLILVDNTPFSLIVPSVFMDFLNVNQDYYERYLYGTATRILRIIFFLISLLGPSIYIAFTTFHQEMIPVSLLISIAQSRAGVPFPAFVEALLMEITFEALREASIRLPKVIGQAVTIVGALVIGEAAVQAGLVSNAMVIVVALTGIASFTIPTYNAGLAIRVLRFPIIFLAAGLGIFGIIFALLILLVHLSSLRSFGVPYLSPFSPLTIPDLKDTIVRAPLWFSRKRPTFIAKTNVIKEGKDLKPGREDYEK